MVFSSGFWSSLDWVVLFSSLEWEKGNGDIELKKETKCEKALARFSVERALYLHGTRPVVFEVWSVILGALSSGAVV